MADIKDYIEFKKKINKLSYICNVLYYDASTDCPKLSKENSFIIQDELNKEIYDLNQSIEYKKLIQDLALDENLTSIYAKAIEKEIKELNRISKIPSEIYKKHLENTSRAYLTWENGRESGDFFAFENELKELLEYYKFFIKQNETEDLKGYDVLLSIFEEEFKEEDYDLLFDAIEKEIIPLIKKILENPKKTIISDKIYPISKQKELTEIVRNILGYDNNRGTIRETMHPYTINIGENDVRITTNYDEKNIFSNLYSVMHEIGHALYQLNIDNKYKNTILNQSPSMAFDESQSRFIENYIGRDKKFLKYIKPQIDELFVEYKNISLDDFYRFVNKVEANLIRVDADELTYPVHILIRYKIEKELFSNKLNVDGISDRFADLMQEYLGIRPNNKKEGCYQDVHWSSDFGYFPTYALGSAIGAQLLFYLKKELDFDKLLESGDLKPILDWLAKNIHKNGAYYSTRELIKKITGEDFNFNYYITYLKDKFCDLYEVEK